MHFKLPVPGPNLERDGFSMLLKGSSFSDDTENFIPKQVLRHAHTSNRSFAGGDGVRDIYWYVAASDYHNTKRPSFQQFGVRKHASEPLKQRVILLMHSRHQC
jgi:hypothetical protein